MHTEKRSRRLRKKLHLGEFREYGFRMNYRLLDPATEMKVLADMAEITLPRAMAFLYERSGQLFLSRASGGSLNEDDHGAVRDWLETRADLDAFDVGPLEDAWHPPRTVMSLTRPRNRTRVLALLGPAANP